MATNIAAQENLVPNGSFEEHFKIPDGRSSWDSNSLNTILPGWHNPTNGSPDYFHRLSSNPHSSLPNSRIAECKGYDWNCADYTNILKCDFGQAYVGSALSLSQGNYGFLVQVEYIQSLISTTLKKNHRYVFSIYTSISDSSEFKPTSIGVLFSENKVRNYYSSSLNNPKWTNFDKSYQPNYFIDSSAFQAKVWSRSNYSFKAKGYENWITIGCFFNKEKMHTFYDSKGDFIIYTYFFIDNVSLVEIPCLVGQDTACQGEKVTFYSTFAGPFEWLHQGEVFSRDSIVEITAHESGWYFLKTPNGQDSIYLTVIENKLRGSFKDSQYEICQGEEANISLPNGYKYLWEDSIVSNKRQFKEETEQKVIVTKSKNCQLDTFVVKIDVNSIPQLESFKRYFELCPTDSKPFVFVSFPDSFSYLWYDESRATERYFDKEGSYPFRYYNQANCENNDSITIKELCDVVVHIPNAFTPMGKNPVFKPYLKYASKASLTIYNRWGEKIYHETSNSPSWDGQYRGNYCQQGLYNYHLTIFSEKESLKHHFTGEIYLMK